MIKINQKNIFRIASMTKVLGSVAALQLVEQGKITSQTSHLMNIFQICLKENLK